TALPSRTVVCATGEATRLVPRRGFTVAGQCRIPTGLRCTPSRPGSRARARVLYHRVRTERNETESWVAFPRAVRRLAGQARRFRPRLGVRLGQRVELLERIRPEVLGLFHVIAFPRRDHERDAGPAGREWVCPQDPAVLDHELPSQVQSDARARALLSKNLLARREGFVERLRDGLTRHPRPVIGHRDHYALVHRAALQQDRLVLGRVAARVVEELADDLDDSPRIGRRREARMDLAFDRDRGELTRALVRHLP